MPDHTPMTDQEIEEVEKRAAAATEGPWHYAACGEKSNDAVLGRMFDENGNSPHPGRVEKYAYNDDTDRWDYLYEFGDEIAYKENDANYPDFNFIANARTDIPRLIATIRERDKRIAELEEDAEERIDNDNDR